MKKLIFAIFLFAFSGFLWALPGDFFVYLERQCTEAGVPYAMVGAILYQENKDLDPGAVHVNRNGSRDLGLFQLSSRYLQNDFLPRYWHYRERFRWDNPYHSAYVAVRLLRRLYDLFPGAEARDRYYQVALAYNCGPTAVLAGDVPISGVEYAVRVVKSVWR
jgi:hypothetical protein